MSMSEAKEKDEGAQGGQSGAEMPQGDSSTGGVASPSSIVTPIQPTPTPINPQPKPGNSPGTNPNT